MSVVLVHGCFESARVWAPLVRALGGQDVVALSPPGFGAPVARGWRASVTAYRDWLADELVALGGPVDLVGHDWGSAHVLAVAMTRPELVRTWCTDAIGWLPAHYTWPALARAVQGPGAGEGVVAAMSTGSLGQRTDHLLALGVPAEVAEVLAAGGDEIDSRCVLDLMGSAGQLVMGELGADLDEVGARPGLVLLAGEQGDGQGAHRAGAARAGAQVEVLQGLGHWWMLEDPHRGAERLRAFWRGAGLGPSGQQGSP